MPLYDANKISNGTSATQQQSLLLKFSAYEIYMVNKYVENESCCCR